MTRGNFHIILPINLYMVISFAVFSLSLSLSLSLSPSFSSLSHMRTFCYLSASSSWMRDASLAMTFTNICLSATDFTTTGSCFICPTLHNIWTELHRRQNTRSAGRFWQLFEKHHFSYRSKWSSDVLYAGILLAHATRRASVRRWMPGEKRSDLHRDVFGNSPIDISSLICRPWIISLQ